MGLVEGLTEFLPISSTGHLIVTGSLIGFHDEKAKKLLKDNIDVLHKIVEVLMKEETVEGSYIMDLLGQNKSKVEPVGG